MDNNELLLAIRQVVKEEITVQVEPINKRLDAMQNNLNNMQEELTMLHSGQNYLIEWVDKIDATVKDISLGLPR